MKKVHIPLIAGILLILTFSLLCGEVTFEKWYGYQYEDVGYDVLLDSDGGYLVVGHLTRSGEYFTDGFFMKTDSLGDTLFVRTYGGDLNDGFRSFVRTPEGGFLCAGFTNSSGAGVNDLYILKIDSVGDSLWARTFGTAGFEAGHKIIEAHGGGYLVVGYTEDFSGYDRDIYLVKIDSLGNTVWERTYGVVGTGYYEGGSSLIPRSDGGYLIAGFTNSHGAGMADGYLLKVDSLGDSLWATTYGTPNSDEFFSITDCFDGGYAVAGFSDGTGAGSPDVSLIRFNASHDSIWSCVCGGTGIDRGFWVCPARNGAFGVIGHSEVESGNFDVYFIKIDSLGNSIWEQTIGGSDIDDGYCVKETPDSGFILVGTTRSYGAGYRDIYLIRTDSLGLGVCESDDRSRNTELRFSCSPNPFTTSSTITTERLSEHQNIREPELKIYDISGRRVREISLLPFSFYLGVTWDGRDEANQVAPPGIYILKMGRRCVGKVVKIN
jgi:hypothetical protein